MSIHNLSCFEIENASALRMDYRLVNLDGPFDSNLGDGDLAERNLQQLVKRLQYDERIPVAIERFGPEPRLAIPANHLLKRTEYELTPDVATLTPQNEVHALSFSSGGAADRIGLAFLAWYFRTPLYKEDSLWSSGPSTYLSKRPLNYRQDNREIDVFRGFGYRLGWVCNRLCVWIKLTHRYAESSWLLEGYSLDDIQQKLRMRHFLYYYGHRSFPVQLLGLTGKSIAEQCFIPDGSRDPISVYDWTLREASGDHPPPWIQSLDHHSPAIAYRYPSNEKKRSGAAALCKLLVQTEDERVGAVHRMSIVDPQARFAELRKVAETYLARATFGDTPIRIRSTPVQVEPKVFAVPAQEFGQGKTLRVGRNPAADEVPLTQFAKKRWDFLLDPEGGFAVNGSLDAQYIIVPESLERSIAQDFQNRLEKTVRRLAKRSYSFSRIVYADADTRTLKRQVDSITDSLHKANAQSGRGLLILPAHAHRHLHNFLKRKLASSFHFQAVDAGKLADFYAPHAQNGRAVYAVADSSASLYVSYLRYTAMGLLLVNRQWPWVLHDGTHYDMYIALDVLNHTAAFTFFSQGGRHCYVQTVESQQSEKLLRQQVRSVVYEALRNQLRQGGPAPRFIVLRRDGKAFRCEWFGFRDAVEQLKRDGLLPEDVLYGIVEVHKTNAEGVRLAEESRDESLRNPNIGAWEILNPKEGIICTTGFPFRLRGSANPLLVRIAAGELNLEYVLEDTFDMSQLCWPVPDGCIRLSIDLKLCDETLRSVASAADDDEGQFGEEETDDGTTDERLAVGWNP